jgi:hypothetical protein
MEIFAVFPMPMHSEGSIPLGQAETFMIIYIYICIYVVTQHNIM